MSNSSSSKLGAWILVCGDMSFITSEEFDSGPCTLVWVIIFINFLLQIHIHLSITELLITFFKLWNRYGFFSLRSNKSKPDSSFSLQCPHQWLRPQLKENECVCCCCCSLLSPTSSNDRSLNYCKLVATAVWIDFNFNFSQNSAQSFIWNWLRLAVGLGPARQSDAGFNENIKMFLKQITTWN